MPTKQAVKAEVERIGWDKTEIISVDAPEVKLAISYLHSIGREDMAAYLEQIARQGLIRAGPFKGFLAIVYGISYNEEAILLSDSDSYPQYNNILQRAASLIHEIGATSRFVVS